MTFVTILAALVACSSDHSNEPVEVDRTAGNLVQSNAENTASSGDDRLESSSAEFSEPADANDSATNLAQSQEENNVSSSNSRAESSSTESYGVIPYDTTKNYDSPNASTDVNGGVTSSSKAEYNFKTESTILHAAFNAPTSLVISAYYDELGLRIGVTDKNVSNAVVYRILPTSELKYIGWMWNAAYYHIENCDRDLGLFVDKCASLSGELENYIGESSCDSRHRLELSCVFPQNSQLSDKDYLDSTAMAEKEFAEKYWDVPVKPIDEQVLSTQGSSLK